MEYYHQLAGADTLTGYRWEVSASGQVVGAYWYGVTPFTSTPTEILGPYLYRQHACTG